MSKDDLLAKAARLADKATGTVDEREPGMSEGPVPLVEPNGHIDIVFKMTTLSNKDEDLVFDALLDARGHPVDVGHWFNSDDDSDVITLRLPWQPGPPLSDPTVKRDGKAHRNGQPTEKIAAQLVRPNSGTQRAKVLGAFMANYRDGGTGFTDEELATHLDMNLYSAAPRRLELVEGGWLRASGLMRSTRLNRPSTVWEMTPRAIEHAGLRRKDQP